MKGITSVMPFACVRVSLIPAPDDPSIVSGALQAMFGKFRQFLRVRSVKVSTPMFYHDADAAAGGYVGEFILPLGDAIRPPLATVLSAWFAGRAGRAVGLNIGERQVEARSTEEAESFLRRAQQVRERAWASDEDPVGLAWSSLAD
jgi:hypothetical protein